MPHVPCGHNFYIKCPLNGQSLGPLGGGLQKSGHYLQPHKGCSKGTNSSTTLTETLFQISVLPSAGGTGLTQALHDKCNMYFFRDAIGLFFSVLEFSTCLKNNEQLFRSKVFSHTIPFFFFTLPVFRADPHY